MKGRAPIDKLRAELRAKFPPDWQERTMSEKPICVCTESAMCGPCKTAGCQPGGLCELTRVHPR